jgi:hypothetical protein
MTSSVNLDPFEMWRQVVTKLEGGMNSLANSGMSSEQFTRAAHQFSQVSTGLQQTFEKALDGYFKALNLPSRKDIVDLADTLQRLEEKIDLLLPMEVREPFENRPLRTRQPASPTDNTTKPATKQPQGGQ